MLSSEFRTIRQAKIMTDKLTENMPRIRIAWKGDGISGHGEWFSESSRKNLMQWIEEMKKEYPDIKHWIEEER